MELLSGTKSGDDILMLSGGREIALDNLWAIRVLLFLVVANSIVFEPGAYFGPGGLTLLFSSIVILLPVYWLALRLASRESEDTARSDGVEW